LNFSFSTHSTWPPSCSHAVVRHCQSCRKRRHYCRYRHKLITVQAKCHRIFFLVEKKEEEEKPCCMRPDLCMNDHLAPSVWIQWCRDPGTNIRLKHLLPKAYIMHAKCHMAVSPHDLDITQYSLYLTIYKLWSLLTACIYRYWRDSSFFFFFFFFF
jgi:hypothetical protein